MLRINLVAPDCPTAQATDSPLYIKGTEGRVVTLARCCHPIPGDLIKGYVSPGRGIVVHTHVCKNMTAHRHPHNWLDLAWADELQDEFFS